MKKEVVIQDIGSTSDSGFRNLPVELYRTDNSCYVFDAGKVAFLEVDALVFDMLNVLREQSLGPDVLAMIFPHYTAEEVRDAWQEIEALRKHGYFSKSDFCRNPQYTRADFVETLSHRLSGFTVYITTECNLACSYCIYGGDYDSQRGLSGVPMTWETARNMLDFLAAHSAGAKSLRLDFFGGEPLLAFDLLKRSVAYLKTILGADRPPVLITIASNGTILTDDMLSFLVEHQILFQVSMDGGREVHDRERRFRSQKHGSYDLVMKNLQRIYDFDAEYFRQAVRMKGVMTMQALGREDGSFSDNRLVQILENEGHLMILLKEPHYDVVQDADFFEQIHRLGQRMLETSGVAKLSDFLDTLSFRQRTFFTHVFGEFTEVQSANKVYFGDADRVTFRKGCLMGFQEGAVHPDGDISICHKATSFVIGNVNRGSWDFDKIWDLHSRLHGWHECGSCFVQRFCTLCYEKLRDGSADWVQSRAGFCEFTRTKYRLIFGYMLRFLDRNPELWSDLDRRVEERIEERLKELREEAE